MYILFLFFFSSEDILALHMTVILLFKAEAIYQQQPSSNRAQIFRANSYLRWTQIPSNIFHLNCVLRVKRQMPKNVFCLRGIRYCQCQVLVSMLIYIHNGSINHIKY